MSERKVITDLDVLLACNVEFQCYDFDHPITIRSWLAEAMNALVTQEEAFSGKRPFGNGGWLSYLATPFIMTGLLENEYDEGDYDPPEYYPKDRAAGRALVQRAVRLLGARL